jgi:hypothetical protein
MRRALFVALVGTALAGLGACRQSREPESNDAGATGDQGGHGGGDAAATVAVDCKPDPAAASFKPAPFTANAPAMACTQAQLDAYYQVCFASHDGTCDTRFGGASGSSEDATCGACVSGNGKNGVLFQNSWLGFAFGFDVPGCVQALAPTMSGCANTLAALIACQDAACVPCRPTTTAPSIAPYQACAKAVATGVCTNAVNAWNACLPMVRASAASVCVNYTTEQQQFNVVAKALCLKPG